MPTLPGVQDLVRWGGALVDELAGLPVTLGHTRSTMARLPHDLETLVRALEETTTALGRALPELSAAIGAMNQRIDNVDRLASALAEELTRTAGTLERILPEVSGAVAAMDGRLERLDRTIADLGQIVFGVIDGIPGVRRVLRRSQTAE
ncbi:MAG TPA: hypothetical protein VKA21_15060 [Candidatus Binatia bacterium]|nr:hypothetical protein [Candidatus Binatia bacterium]